MLKNEISYLKRVYAVSKIIRQTYSVERFNWFTICHLTCIDATTKGIYSLANTIYTLLQYQQIHVKYC